MVQETLGWQGVVAELQLVDGRIVVGVWGGSEGQESVVWGSK